jgi:hypothetical protein
MSRDDDSRFVELDLGVFRGFSSTAYRGTEDSANLVTPQGFVWRHTSYGDVNGDGIADRVVALSWPESSEIYRDIGSTPIWKDSKGRCGGVNRVYLGNGRGQFYETDMTIGGLYAWPGGPRAASLSLNDVQTAPAVTFEYTPPVNQQAMVDLDGDGRAEMIQICGADWANAIPDKGGAPTGYNLKENSTNARAAPCHCRRCGRARPRCCRPSSARATIWFRAAITMSTEMVLRMFMSPPIPCTPRIRPRRAVPRPIGVATRLPRRRVD